MAGIRTGGRSGGAALSFGIHVSHPSQRWLAADGRYEVRGG